MRLLAFLSVTLPLLACAPVIPTSEAGLCLALGSLVDAHALALQAQDVPDAALITGARLVAGVDAGCGS